MRNLAPRPAERNGGAFSHEDHLPHIILFPAVCYSCFSAIANGVRKWRSSVAVARGEAPASGASGKTPAAAAIGKTPAPPATGKLPVPAARAKTIEVGLGSSSVTHAENQSKRVCLQGADASF